MTQRKNLLTLATFLIFSLIFGSCGKSGGPANGLSTKNAVVWYIAADIDRMNPMLSSGEESNYVQGEIWEALNGNNPRDPSNFIPQLASLPKISDDHLTYTYQVDPQAHWSDGKPVTAQDVIFSFKTVKDPNILNAAAQRSYFGTLDSVWSPNGDNAMVAFHWSKYVFNIPLITSFVKILPKHILDPKNLTDKFSWADLASANPSNPALQEFATWFESDKIGRDPAYMIGSGPYKYENWITNDRVILRRDSNYWGRNRPWQEAYPDEIIFKTIKDLNAALTALKAKDIDIFDRVTASQYLTELDTSKLTYLKKDTVYVNWYTYIGWNNAKPLFHDKMMRKAMTMLINRDEIMHSVLKDMVKKQDGPVTPTQPDFDPTVKQPDYNPDSAKKLLAAAGWKMGNDGVLEKTIDGKVTPFKFTFLIPSGSDVLKQVCLVIVNQLKGVGIQAEITQIEWSVFLENMKSHQFDATVSSWVGNTGTEEEISQEWESTQADNRGSNAVSYKDPEADKLMEAIKVEPDKEKRHALSHQLQHLMVDDQPVTFFYSPPSRIAWVDRFDNFELFKSRPPYSAQYWIVRGSGVQRIANDAVMSMNPSERTEPKPVSATP
jgi:peptide/nickel transport system substrate-binding protein